MLEKHQILEMHFTINTSEIAYFKFLLEGYDGMAILSTTNSKRGEVLLRYVSCFKNDLMAIVSGVEKSKPGKVK